MPDSQFSKPRFCSQCGHPVMVDGARFCKDCGAALEATGSIRLDFGMRPVIAFVLSAIPGLGHVYQRHPWRGLAWFFGVMIAYGVSRPLGFVLHLICAANAAVYAGRFNRGANRAGGVTGRTDGSLTDF